MARISESALRNSSGVPSRGLGRYCGYPRSIPPILANNRQRRSLRCPVEGCRLGHRPYLSRAAASHRSRAILLQAQNDDALGHPPPQRLWQSRAARWHDLLHVPPVRRRLHLSVVHPRESLRRSDSNQTPKDGDRSLFRHQPRRRRQRNTHTAASRPRTTRNGSASSLRQNMGI